jgi:hypothetical protein
MILNALQHPHVSFIVFTFQGLVMVVQSFFMDSNQFVPINTSYDPKGRMFKDACVCSPLISNRHASIILVTFLLVLVAN